MVRACRLDHLSVSQSVWKVYCGKMDDWIRMPFGMVSGIGREMRVLDEGGDRRRRTDIFWGCYCGFLPACQAG